jgi:FkbM family methyltransferase
MEDETPLPLPPFRIAGQAPLEPWLSNSLKEKIATVSSLLREGGPRKLIDYLWIRLQVLSKEHKQEVRLDGCIFDLTGIPNGSTKLQLITNQYESSERQAVLRYLKRDIPVIELGGSMGVVACVTNKLLKDPAAHVVVEANPMAIPRLEQNRKLNGRGFQIVNRAIAYGSDLVTFSPSAELAGTSITRPGDQPSVTVQAVTLGELARDRGFKRFSLVCDIEGLEYDLVCQESDILKNADTIIMETHARFIGEEKLSDMMTRLEQLGFRTVAQFEFVVVLQQ